MVLDNVLYHKGANSQVRNKTKDDTIIVFSSFAGGASIVVVGTAPSTGIILDNPSLSNMFIRVHRYNGRHFQTRVKGMAGHF